MRTRVPVRMEEGDIRAGSPGPPRRVGLHTPALADGSPRGVVRVASWLHTKRGIEVDLCSAATTSSDTVATCAVRSTAPRCTACCPQPNPVQSWLRSTVGWPRSKRSTQTCGEPGCVRLVRNLQRTGQGY